MLLTHRDAAAMLECTLGALYRMVLDGRIVPLKVAGKFGTENRYHLADVERLRDERASGRRVSRMPVSEETLAVVRRMRADGYAWRYCAAVAHVGVPKLKEMLGAAS